MAVDNTYITISTIRTVYMLGYTVGWVDFLNRRVCLVSLRHSLFLILLSSDPLCFVVHADFQACRLVQLGYSLWGHMHQLFRCDVGLLSHVGILSH